MKARIFVKKKYEYCKQTTQFECRVPTYLRHVSIKLSMVLIGLDLESSKNHCRHVANLKTNQQQWKCFEVRTTLF